MLRICCKNYLLIIVESNKSNHIARCYTAFVINGFLFHTVGGEMNRRCRNSSIVVTEKPQDILTMVT